MKLKFVITILLILNNSILLPAENIANFMKQLESRNDFQSILGSTIKGLAAKKNKLEEYAKKVTDCFNQYNKITEELNSQLQASNDNPNPQEMLRLLKLNEQTEATLTQSLLKLVFELKPEFNDDYFDNLEELLMTEVNDCAAVRRAQECTIS